MEEKTDTDLVRGPAKSVGMLGNRIIELANTRFGVDLQLELLPQSGEDASWTPAEGGEICQFRNNG